MRNVLKAAIAGAIAIGCLAAVPNEASAMPVSPIVASDAGLGMTQGGDVETVYYRRGWGWRGYGFRRYGWRRPYGWGWRRPFYVFPRRRFYRW